MIGREVSLADIYEIAAKITRVYAERGYLLSIAIVPAQDIENGRAVIKILEGYVSEIEIAGDPGPARDLLAAHGRNLMAMRPLTRPALERYLLLAGDLPGLDVSGVLERSTAGDGGVKLVLDAARKTFDASLDINNRGSRAIGRERAAVFLGESGALTGGEELGFQLVQTFDGDELTHLLGRAASVLNAEGTKLSCTGSYIQSRPGTELLEALAFNSEGWSAAAELSHPLIRARSRNLRVFTSFELRNLRSRFDDVLEPILALLNSLSERDAIPGERLNYWNDPRYNTGRLKASNKGAFERNSCTGSEICTHPHFIPYLRYFLFGPDLPEAVIAGFEEKVGNPDWVTSSDITPISKYARDLARLYRLDGAFAPEEFFKLCLDLGLGLSIAAIVRRSVMQHR